MCLEIGRNISQKLTYEGMWRWNAKRFVHSCASIALFVFGCLHSHRFRSSCCTHRLPPVPICQRSHTHSLKFLVNVCVVYLFPVTQLVEDSMTAVLLIYWFICCRGNILIVLATSFGEYYQTVEGVTCISDTFSLAIFYAKSSASHYSTLVRKGSVVLEAPSPSLSPSSLPPLQPFIPELPG